MPADVLGISAWYHDSAACLLRDGVIVAAAQEERFSRKKHDARFPREAARFCLNQAGVSLADLRCVAFYDKPMLKFERLMETYIAFAPRGIGAFLTSMPIWLREKLMLRRVLEKELAALEPDGSSSLPPILFGEHHESHAASAFYPSPFRSAAVLSMDGVGEWATTSAWVGDGDDLSPLWEIAFPHSIGLLYSAFTYQTGFAVNDGEYKVMGLAPYGEPTYVRAIYDHLIDLKPDGTFRLDLDYFDYCTGLRMTSPRFDRIFGGPPREPESPLTQREMDLARSVQEVTGEVMLRLARTLRRETGRENLAMAGGVALNSVGNGRIVREGVFRRVWIQPAPGDAGGAVGAAYSAWRAMENQPRPSSGPDDAMRGAFLGPEFDDEAIESVLAGVSADYERIDDEALARRTASALASGQVVGWFQGPMEFGPRALGGRSILGDPRNPDMQSILNCRIKRRESFRPFAPSVRAPRARDYFDTSAESPYMQLVVPVRQDRRGELPAITHVDGSARIQTVRRETNPKYDRLLEAFEDRTGCPVIVNTSFNVRGEPIVCTPLDAYRCFMETELDVLVLGSFILYKERQAPGAIERLAAPAPEPHANPGARQLRIFAAVMGAGFALVGLWPWMFSGAAPLRWALALMVALVVTGLARPSALRGPWRVWMRLGHLLAWINTRIVLGLIYYGLLVPIGLAWRLTGRDPMKRRFDPDAASYRIPRLKRPSEHMWRQY